MNKDNTVFTSEMKKTHTIYMPDMLHYHNELLIAAFRYGGYKLAVVPEYERVPEDTFRFINSAYCTCAMDIIGNIMAHITEPGVDLEHIAILEPQAGGACRAGNYYDLIIQCVKKSGHKIPVLSLNFRGEESHPGFKINPKMLFGALAAVCYGDLLMSLYQQIRPYEKNKGETDALYHKWVEKLSENISRGKNLFFKNKIYKRIVADFKNIPCYSKTEKKLTKAGVEVIYDDRDVRPGVMFADADLIGVPVRVMAGPRNLENGQIEIASRDKSIQKLVNIDNAVDEIKAVIQELFDKINEKVEEPVFAEDFE